MCDDGRCSFLYWRALSALYEWRGREACLEVFICAYPWPPQEPYLPTGAYRRILCMPSLPWGVWCDSGKYLSEHDLEWQPSPAPGSPGAPSHALNMYSQAGPIICITSIVAGWPYVEGKAPTSPSESILSYWQKWPCEKLCLASQSSDMWCWLGRLEPSWCPSVWWLQEAFPYPCDNLPPVVIQEGVGETFPCGDSFPF